MDMRKQALEEERKRREELEKRLQEETNRRQKLIEREVKLREKQRAQVQKYIFQCCFAQKMVLISAALLLRINLPTFFDKAFSHVPETNFPPLHAYFPLLHGFNQVCADSITFLLFLCLNITVGSRRKTL